MEKMGSYEMKLTRNQMLKYWRFAVRWENHTHLCRRKPKFLVGQTVRIITKEPYMGSWTYMDDVRRIRKGQTGIIIGMSSLPDKDVPERYSNHSYDVRFKDGCTIYFAEEHLTRSR